MQQSRSEANDDHGSKEDAHEKSITKVNYPGWEIG